MLLYLSYQSATHPASQSDAHRLRAICIIWMGEQKGPTPSLSSVSFCSQRSALPQNIKNTHFLFLLFNHTAATSTKCPILYGSPSCPNMASVFCTRKINEPNTSIFSNDSLMRLCRAFLQYSDALAAALFISRDCRNKSKRDYRP